MDEHWTGKGVRDFVLAIAVTCSDDDMNAVTKALLSELGDRSMRFHLWDAHVISRSSVPTGASKAKALRAEAMILLRERAS